MGTLFFCMCKKQTLLYKNIYLTMYTFKERYFMYLNYIH